ncbi:MAG: hypothetical protein AB2653_05730 [Candidatus Thiodiazotropha endolucinida]
MCDQLCEIGWRRIHIPGTYEGLLTGHAMTSGAHITIGAGSRGYKYAIFKIRHSNGFCPSFYGIVPDIANDPVDRRWIVIHCADIEDTGRDEYHPSNHTENQYQRDACYHLHDSPRSINKKPLFTFFH